MKRRTHREANDALLDREVDDDVFYDHRASEPPSVFWTVVSVVATFCFIYLIFKSWR